MTSKRRKLVAAAAFAGAALLLAGGTRGSLAIADPALDLGFVALASQGALALLVLGGAALVGAPRRARLGWVRGRLRGGVPLLAALGFVALSAALDAALELTGWRAASHLDAIDRVLGAARGGSILLLLLGLVVAPPVCEELLFRGLLQQGLVRRLGAAGGVALTAVLFGASHLDPVHAVAAFALGLYLGTVALVDGGVRTSMLCHGLNNALAVGTATLGVAGAGSAGLGRVAFGLALAALGLEAARRAARRSQPAEPPLAPQPTAEP